MQEIAGIFQKLEGIVQRNSQKKKIAKHQ